jgi:predicted transcriptional regulator
MSQPQLEHGEFVHDDREELRERVSEMQAERDSARRELAALKKSIVAMTQAIAAVARFAENDPATPSVDKSKWDFLGKKIGGKAPEIIEMLLAQPEMTVTQLHKAVRCSYETARYTVRKMREAGIVVTNGSAVSLKS